MFEVDQLAWITLSYVLGSVILLLSYFLMYRVHSRTYLKHFTITWGLLAIAYTTLFTYYITDVMGYIALFFLIIVCAGFTFHIGALSMTGKPHATSAKKLKIVWFSLVFLSLFFSFPSIVYAFIFYGSFGFFLFCSAFAFFKTDLRQHQIVASFMALLGLLNITYGFTYDLPLFLPIGYLLISFVGFFLGIGILALHLQTIQEEQQAMRSHLLYLRYQDDLTDVYNRNFLDKALHKLNTSASLPMGVIMIDVNELKVINDTYGHRKGDFLLTQVSLMLKGLIGTHDILLRYGGDEFLILMPNTNQEKCSLMKASILAQCEATKIMEKSISIAVGGAIRTSLEQSFNDVFDQAEEEMYHHKHALHTKGKP